MKGTPDADTAFERQVAVWVRSAIDAGADNLESLLERLPGVYPTLVTQTIAALVNQGLLAPDKAARMMTPTQGFSAERVDRSFLPLPHPLNFEWRFTPQSSDLLLDRASDVTRPGDTVLLFGTPGVAIASLSRSFERRMIFIGEDNLVTRRVRALNDDVSGPLWVESCSAIAPTPETANVVILDPPWYLDFIRPMLATASSACVVGGYILISLPPEGARPGSVQDRDRVLSLAERLGLVHVESRPLALRYETPFFETNALAACGLTVPHSWRRGDLVLFRKATPSNRSVVTATLRKERWCEVSVGRMRLLVRRDRASQVGGALGSLVPGDILPTVSRRDKRRQNARVWTSGNRIFSSTAPETVIAAALAISREQSDSGTQLQLHTTVEDHNELEQVGCALRELAAIEAAEEHGRISAPKGWSEEWTSISIASDST